MEKEFLGDCRDINNTTIIIDAIGGTILRISETVFSNKEPFL
jgi:hypothetical protein